MATWKVQIHGMRRPAIDLDQLLGVVLAMGRQLAEEERQRQLREAKQALDGARSQDDRSPAEQTPAAPVPEAR